VDVGPASGAKFTPPSLQSSSSSAIPKPFCACYLDFYFLERFLHESSPSSSSFACVREAAERDSAASVGVVEVCKRPSSTARALDVVRECLVRKSAKKVGKNSHFLLPPKINTKNVWI
jgi:hypothetical protein